MWRRKLLYLADKNKQTTSSTPASTKGASRWIVILRVALLVLAAAAAALGFVLAGQRDRAFAEAGGQYVCPMHSEVTATAPRECPICGMALVKRSELNNEGAPDRERATPGEADEEAIAAARLLSSAVGGVAPTLVGFSPAPVRRHVQRQEPFAAAWLESTSMVAALVYRDIVPSLAPGEHALFYPTSAPNRSEDVWFATAPVTPWDRSMSIVHFSLQGDAKDLQPGAAGWVQLDPKSRESLVVPSTAVVQSGDGPYVLVFAPARGTAMKRSIEIGKIFSGWAAVLSGVSPRELVVSMNTFFWDAERRLQTDQRAQNGAIP